MLDRRKILTLLAGGALALPGAAVLAGPPRTPPGQGGAPPGQAAAPGGDGKGKKNNKNGRTLLGEKIKENGNHKLDKADKIDVSADVRGGKVVGFHAKHPDKGELQIGKVKSTEKFAVLEQRLVPGAEPGVQTAAVVVVWYYAYWFVDDFGNYWYYWFPVEYIVDDGSWIIYYA